MRAAGDPAALMPAVRATMRDIDPTLPILDLRTQDEQLERLHASERLFAWLSTFFGVTAVALAVAGLHGLLAQAVQRRTGEFGLRLAVGATPANVGGMIVREAVARRRSAPSRASAPPQSWPDGLPRCCSASRRPIR